MNDIFDIRRFGAFALKWYKERSVFSILVWVLLSIVVYIKSFFGDLGAHVENWERLNYFVGETIKESSRTYIWSLLIIITVLTLKTSLKLFSVKTKSYWLLPISKLEKVVFVIVNSIIVPFIIYTSFYFAVNVVNDHKFVAWQNSDISIEDVENKYGDVETSTDYSGVEYYRIYPKIAFTDLLIANVWSSRLSKDISGKVKATSLNSEDIEINGGSGLKETFGMIFIVFSLCLWIGVSRYRKSAALAIVSHVALFLVLCATVFYVGQLTHDYPHWPGILVYGDNLGGIYLLLQSKLLYLLPIAYFWVAWKKIETMQIK